MEKIKSITLRNFKFFYGTEATQPQNKLVLDGNHLLLYGENGSGKSSLYWALYTFLQSAIKTQQSQIEKYFDPLKAENLRNRFSDNDHESGIEIVFQSSTVETIKKLRRKTDRTYELGCFGDNDVKKVLEGSDFFNYKFLSKVYDFRNSETINLFKVFEREIFMFLNFEQAYIDHNGDLSNKTYVSDWWKFISNASQDLPPEAIEEKREAYDRLKNITIPKFIELLKFLLNRITHDINKILKEDFQEQFSIDFDTESIKCDYDAEKGSFGVTTLPTISLKVKFNHDSLRENNREILKPHTFLNEARLTAIALAIRLAILKDRLQIPGYARILVLDDLLLSLDMSNRDKVLDIILSDSFITTYQLMILSHDKAFYNLCKRRIQDRFDEGWVFKEVYQHETETGIPCPFIPDQKDYLDLAQKYLKEFDYPASANYLRKEAEKVLKHLLPENLQYKIGKKLESELINLDGLITAFLKFYKELGADITVFKKLLEHKDLLLNPLSHDNINSPIYKNELLSVITLLTNLNKLEVKTLGIADPDDSNIFHFQETDNNGDNWEYAFTLKENWRAIKGLDNVWRFSNPKINVIGRTNTIQNTVSEVIKTVLPLNNAYTNFRFALGIRVKKADNSYMDNVKPLNEIIYKGGNLVLL